MRDYRLHIALLVGATSMLLMALTGFAQAVGGSNDLTCPPGTHFDVVTHRCKF
jgi:hypothetical protein